MQPENREHLQWLLVIIVLLAAVASSFIKNDFTLMRDLTTLCFGYYFGSASSNPPTKPA